MAKIKRKKKKKKVGFYLDGKLCKLCATRICQTLYKLVVQWAAADRAAHELGKWAQKQNGNGPSIGC